MHWSRQSSVAPQTHRAPARWVHGSLAVTRKACACTSQRPSVPNHGAALLGATVSLAPRLLSLLPPAPLALPSPLEDRKLQLVVISAGQLPSSSPHPFSVCMPRCTADSMCLSLPPPPWPPPKAQWPGAQGLGLGRCP